MIKLGKGKKAKGNKDSGKKAKGKAEKGKKKAKDIYSKHDHRITQQEMEEDDSLTLPVFALGSVAFVILTVILALQLRKRWEGKMLLEQEVRQYGTN